MGKSNGGGMELALREGNNNYICPFTWLTMWLNKREDNYRLRAHEVWRA
jgi:hypothetical protein